jgi:hypothetical protein
MLELTDHSQPEPVNDNDFFRGIDFTLLELFRARREILSRDVCAFSSDKQAEHWNELKRLDGIISRFLSFLGSRPAGCQHKL